MEKRKKNILIEEHVLICVRNELTGEKERERYLEIQRQIEKKKDRD